MKVGKGAVVSDTARLVGNVTLGENVFVLFGAVLRGDTGTIEVGARSNVQDNAVLHADGPFPCRVGEDVSIGHGAVVHGCTVGEGSVIGINSTVLNGASIGRGCIVGAGAVVPEGAPLVFLVSFVFLLCLFSGAVIPDFSLAVGVPARVVRRDESLLQRGKMNAEIYQTLRQQYAAGDTHRIWGKSKL
jgi:carbonic anhydrase/acetyltransferase-like protein (isoleucine patch superfamily)